MVIDQHAYHERILYWLLENRISSQPVERQRLLVATPLGHDLLTQPLPWHVELALRALEEPRSLRHMEAKLDDGDTHAPVSRGRRVLALLLEIGAVGWVG